MGKITNYDKLVRDLIPEVLAAKGIAVIVETVSREELHARLTEKLKEEVQEFAVDVNEEEIADILEVLKAIISTKGFSEQRIEEIRKKKLTERGGFTRGLILKQTEEEI